MSIPDLVTCDICEMTYVPDEPGDLIVHEERHSRFLRAINPAHHKSFAAALKRSHGKPVHVSCSSPTWAHLEVYNRALVFAKEIEAGRVAWSEDGNMPATCHAYLFGDDCGTLPIGAIAGACGFLWAKYTDGSAHWSLEWIWFCPAVRRKGVLTRQWNWLESHYGRKFEVSEPLSPAMEGFLRKQAAKQGAPRLHGG